MAFIATVPLAEATGEARVMYERGQARFGYVPNHTKLFSHRPGVWAGWEALLGSIRSNMDPRRYELVTVAAARALRCSYCALAHGVILRERFYSAEHLTAITHDPAAAGLSPADAAIMSFAEKVSRDADAITPADVAALRDHGLTDVEIFDVAAAAAARCFFSKMMDALGAEPDAAYAGVEDGLRRRLTVGRDISTAAVERLPAPGANSLSV
jgi:uncharacterized peroxidase-related enzyme